MRLIAWTFKHGHRAVCNGVLIGSLLAGAAAAGQRSVECACACATRKSLVCVPRPHGKFKVHTCLLSMAVYVLLYMSIRPYTQVYDRLHEHQCAYPHTQYCMSTCNPARGWPVQGNESVFDSQGLPKRCSCYLWVTNKRGKESGQSCEQTSRVGRTASRILRSKAPAGQLDDRRHECRIGASTQAKAGAWLHVVSLRTRILATRI